MDDSPVAFEGDDDGEDWTDTNWAEPRAVTQATAQVIRSQTLSLLAAQSGNSGCSAAAMLAGNLVAGGDASDSSGLTKSSESSSGSMVRRMQLNDNKAGMEGLDKQKINQIIYEASKGSKFYENERLKEEQMSRRIQEQKLKIQSISVEQLNSGTLEADKLLADFEQQRDLSHTIVHVDMDMFYAAVEMRDLPELKNKPMAVGGNAMLSTSNYNARKFGVRAAMPGFIARKLCPDLVIVPVNFDKYTSVSKEVKTIMADYDPNFCPMSLDEAYLNLTEHLQKRKLMSDEERMIICRDSTYAHSRAHCLCDLNEVLKHHGNEALSLDAINQFNDGNNDVSKSDTADDITLQSKSDSNTQTMVKNSTDSTKETDCFGDINKEHTTFGNPEKTTGVCPWCKKELPPFEEKIFGFTDEEAVMELRTRIEQKTRLTASAGIAPNMMLAKVGSDHNKPNGQFKLPATIDAVMDFIKDLPTRKVSGIGKVSEAMLNACGIYTCIDLYTHRGLLYHLYSGISFNYFMRICLGIGSTTVERDSERKSMSTERTFNEINQPADLYRKCEELCESLAEDLQSEQLKGRTVSIKIKTVKFEVKTRAHSLRDYTNNVEEFTQAALDLLRTEIDNCAPQPLRLRLMGVRMSSLLNESLCKGRKQNTIMGAFKRQLAKAEPIMLTNCSTDARIDQSCTLTLARSDKTSTTMSQSITLAPGNEPSTRIGQNGNLALSSKVSRTSTVSDIDTTDGFKTLETNDACLADHNMCPGEMKSTIYGENGQACNIIHFVDVVEQKDPHGIVPTSSCVGEQRDCDTVNVVSDNKKNPQDKVPSCVSEHGGTVKMVSDNRSEMNGHKESSSSIYTEHDIHNMNKVPNDKSDQDRIVIDMAETKGHKESGSCRDTEHDVKTDIYKMNRLPNDLSNQNSSVIDMTEAKGHKEGSSGRDAEHVIHKVNKVSNDKSVQEGNVIDMTKAKGHKESNSGRDTEHDVKTDIYKVNKVPIDKSDQESNVIDMTETVARTTRRTRSGITPNTRASSSKKQKRNRTGHSETPEKPSNFACPVCGRSVMCYGLGEFNKHVDECLDSTSGSGVETCGTVSDNVVVENGQFIHQRASNHKGESGIAATKTDYRTVETGEHDNMLIENRENDKGLIETLEHEGPGYDQREAETVENDANMAEMDENDETNQRQAEICDNVTNIETRKNVQDNVEKVQDNVESVQDNDVQDDVENVQENGEDLASGLLECNREPLVCVKQANPHSSKDEAISMSTLPPSDISGEDSVNCDTQTLHTQPDSEIISMNTVTASTVQSSTIGLGVSSVSPSETTLPTEARRSLDVSNALPDLSNSLSDLPNVFPCSTNVLPDLPNVLPGSSNRLPDLPNVLPDSPNALPDSPNVPPDLPNMLPGSSNRLPDLPNVLPDSPNALPDSPNVPPDLPNVLPDSSNTPPDSPNASPSSSLLVCPVCNTEQRLSSLTQFNQHVDSCLSRGAISELLKEQRQDNDKTKLKRTRHPSTPTSSQNMKKRKTMVPGRNLSCRSIATFFQK